MTDRIRSPLGRYAPLMADPDPHGAHRLAAQRWHDSGDVVLFAADIAAMDWQDRELIKAVAGKRYGPREGDTK